jgi:AcrR family transcriptional regulator
MPPHPADLPEDAPARVLEAAGRAFAIKGFEGATVREICQQAGVNIAAVNYYFRDKERLYAEAVKFACQCQARENPFPDWPPGTPGVTRLRDFIRTMARRMFNDDGQEWCRQLFLREMGNPTAACAELVRDHIQPTAVVLIGILGDLLPDTPEFQRMLTGFSIVGQILFYKFAQPIVSSLVGAEAFRQLKADLVADHVTRFSLQALGLEGTAQAKRAGGRRKLAGEKN